jgi:hypothetical protein
LGSDIKSFKLECCCEPRQGGGEESRDDQDWRAEEMLALKLFFLFLFSFFFFLFSFFLFYFFLFSFFLFSFFFSFLFNVFFFYFLFSFFFFIFFSSFYCLLKKLSFSFLLLLFGSDIRVFPSVPKAEGNQGQGSRAASCRVGSKVPAAEVF